MRIGEVQRKTRSSTQERRKPAPTTPARAPRDAHKAVRRETILNAALEEFSASGFAAARLDDVAKRAGIAKGTIYLYFRDKETLFQELVRATMSPLVGAIEGLHGVDGPVRALAERLVELFVTQIFDTERKNVIRLMITEGARFPKLAEFYHREVLSRVMTALRGLVKRGIEQGELKGDALLRFPQLLAAPGIIAIIWSGLFERYEPLDVRAMMRAHIDLLFTEGRAS